jgi:hypothetical protein
VLGHANENVDHAQHPTTIKERYMRVLTTHELDAQLAEQLPTRELMGGCWHRQGSYTSNTAVAGNSSSGFINVGNGNQVQLLTLGSTNGNGAIAG